MYNWLLPVGSKNAVVNTLILKEKASFSAKAFDFVPSDSWVTPWKRPFNISLKKISGQGKSCTPEMIASWKETSFPTLLSMTYKIFIILVNVDFFIRCTLKSLCI